MKHPKNKLERLTINEKKRKQKETVKRQKLNGLKEQETADELQGLDDQHLGGQP
ncbi:MAG: hypothetical protein ACREHG_09515 [Candidatus Saccharimonadales bacterium]